MFNLFMISLLIFFSRIDPVVPVLQKTAMTPVTQMEYILTHQKTELSQVPQEDDQINTCPTQTVPDMTHVRSIGKMSK